VSSRLASDRRFVEITTPQFGAEVGHRFNVLGDTITDTGKFTFLGTPTGRLATPADNESPRQALRAQRAKN
jgi:hypothetical protein